MPQVLALITARGGSKGLLGKNLLPAGGKPLLVWTVEAAKASSVVDRVVISTDDEEIAAVAREAGCEVPFLRPAELATDTATSLDVVRHALEALPGFDYLILLQPTSPLRTGADIDAAFEAMVSMGATTCVSLCPVEESPYLMYEIGEQGAISPVVAAGHKPGRRQDLPPAYILNGAIYIADRDHIMHGGGLCEPGSAAYVMPRERSLDIDNAEDLALLRRRFGDPS